MRASTPASSRLALVAGLAAVVSAAGCVEDLRTSQATSSLRVTVTSPQDLGSAETRLPDTTRQIAIDVQAVDEGGANDSDLNTPIDVYIHTLGQLTSTGTKIDLRSGRGSASITVPLAFGRTFLWVEDVTETEAHQATYATGTSPTLWYREPLLADISTPDPRGSVTAQLQTSPLEDKQVRVSGSAHGAAGRLLVTGVYADGYTVSDVRYAQPSTTTPYGHVYVFSFSRPVDVRGRPIQIGQTLKFFEGGVDEFNGFTEMNFPSQEIDSATTDLTYLPAPAPIDKEWLRSGGPMYDQLKMEQLEAGVVSVSGGVVCNLDSDFDRFQQWKINIGLGCGTPINVITASQIASFDPRAYVGKTIPKIVGTLRGVNIGRNIWIVLPRNEADLVLQ
jgi:hypothetical protein